MDRILTDETPHREFLDEQSWYKFWSEEELGKHSPIEMALYGGTAADRLSWVFISGYQAALKHVFGDIEPIGWAALVASEDRENTESRPGTEVNEKNGIKSLSGFKSWVAQSRTVDHLIVTAKDGDGDNKNISAYLTPRKWNNVELSHRKFPTFLGDMSQGFAKFDTVDVTSVRRYSKDDIKRFMRSEPPFVMLAATAFMINYNKDLKNSLIQLAKNLAAHIEAPEVAPLSLADLDTSFQSLAAQFEEITLCEEIPNWSNDRRLLSMYSKGIQKFTPR